MSETLATCQPAYQDIVNLTATSLSAGPDLTEAARTDRVHTVVRGTLGLRPTDTTQTLLASLIMGHHLAIMDGFRDIACLTLTPAEAARARMVTVAQTKLVVQLTRELRIARKDALAQTAPGKPGQDQMGQHKTGQHKTGQDQTGQDQPGQDQTAADPRGQRAEAADGVVHHARDGFDACLTELLSACTGTLAPLGDTDTLTPADAERAMRILSQAMAPRNRAASPGAATEAAGVVSGTARGSRAQRRAVMKQQGGFKRSA